MEFLVEQAGGYAGLTTTVAQVDTTQLDAATAQHLMQLVQNLDFFNLPAFVPANSVGADFMRYQITIRQGDQQHQITFVDDDSAEVAPLRQLVSTLRQHG